MRKLIVQIVVSEFILLMSMIALSYASSSDPINFPVAMTLLSTTFCYVIIKSIAEHLKKSQGVTPMCIQFIILAIGAFYSVTWLDFVVFVACLCIFIFITMRLRDERNQISGHISFTSK